MDSANKSSTSTPAKKTIKIQKSVSKTAESVKRIINAQNTKRTWEPDISGKYIRKTSSADIRKPANAVGEHDPYENRNIKAPINNFAALMHVIKGSVGIGLLRMPMAFYHTGFLVGTLNTIFIGSMIAHGVNVLIKTKYKLCKRKRVGHLSYGHAMQYAMEEGPDWMIRFSKFARWMVNIFIIISQVTLTCVYIWAICKNIKIITDEFYCEMFSVRILVWILFPAVVLIMYVPNMQMFTYFSLAGNVLIYASFAWISYYMYQQDISGGRRKYFGNPIKWVDAVAICMYAMEAITVDISVHQYMATPNDFTGFFGIMNMGTWVIISTYVLLGVSGYLVYGSQIKGSLLDHLPENTPISRGIHMLHGVALLANIKLNSFIVIDILWDECFASRENRISETKKTQYHYALLTGYVVLGTIMGMLPVEIIDPFTTVITLLEVSMLLFWFPSLMEICYLWPDNFGPHNWIFYKDLSMFAFGSVVFGIGWYVTLDSFINVKSSTSCATSNTTSG